jgi:hypothetical protein
MERLKQTATDIRKSGLWARQRNRGLHCHVIMVIFGDFMYPYCFVCGRLIPSLRNSDVKKIEKRPFPKEEV